MAAAVAVVAEAAEACDYPGPPPHAGDARAEVGDILWAGFSDATGRYRHGVFGNSLEAGGLRAATAAQGACELFVILPESAVFEDLAPRIADLDGDGSNEVIVVESSLTGGAALAIYGLRDGMLQKLAATPDIGAPRRWLAPAGIADFNQDGGLDIAYVETPHIGGILKFVSFQDGALVQWGQVEGVTNHGLGASEIESLVKVCAGGPELLLPDKERKRLLRVAAAGGHLILNDAGPYRGLQSLGQAAVC